MARKPKYRRHSTRDLGFVEHDGKRRYFTGSFGSPESVAEYRQFLRDAGFAMIVGDAPQGAISLPAMTRRFLRWAETVYPTGSRSYCANLSHAADLLLEFTGVVPAMAFTPLKLKAFQVHLADRKLARKYINTTVGHIRRMYSWAVSEELIAVGIYQALLTVQGLRRGRSNANEPEPRSPVDWAHVKVTLKQLSPTVRTMVGAQWLLGVRSQSLCLARPEQFDRSVNPWIWRPRHKTEHLGHDLIVFVGPKAQKILGPPIDKCEPGKFLFQPRHKRGQRARRFRAFYDSTSYARAVSRAAERAGVPHWSPHQLRHARGTLVREEYGIEAAQAVLGHARMDATQVYARRRLELARTIAIKMG